MTVASKDDVDGIVEIDVDRLSPKITTVIFDVDDTLYDVSTVSLVAVVVIIIVSCFFRRPVVPLRDKSRCVLSSQHDIALSL
jgi:hypothetical protein